MNNKDIRRAITRSGLKYWEVAQAYGYTDSTFSRKLRQELPDHEKVRLLTIIDKLVNEKESA